MLHRAEILLHLIIEVLEPVHQLTTILEVQHQVITSSLPHLAGALTQLQLGLRLLPSVRLAVEVPEASAVVASVEEEEGINSLFFFLNIF